jgi:hypothetical protein
MRSKEYAIGKTINKIGNVQKNTAEEYRADKVLFVITTDGMENTNREFICGQIKKMVELQKSRYGWEFSFLGARINAVEVAGHFGIAANCAQNYHADSEGTQLDFRVLNEEMAEYRSCSAMPESWNEEIEADYRKRSKGGK